MADDGVAALFDARLAALKARHELEADRLAVNIAKSRALRWQSLVIKATLLKQFLRPEAMGVDQPERHILMTLPDEIKSVCQRLTAAA